MVFSLKKSAASFKKKIHGEVLIMTFLREEGKGLEMDVVSQVWILAAKCGKKVCDRGWVLLNWVISWKCWHPLENLKPYLQQFFLSMNF